MTDTRYYWLKMPKDFFSLPAVRYIRSMELGGDILLLYLQMLTESLDKGGKLRLTDQIPFTWQTLAVTLGLSVDTVSQGMKILTELKLVEVLPDETIFMTEQEKFTQSEVSSAHRMREKRKRDALQNSESKNQDISESEAKNKESEEDLCKPKASHCDVEEEKEIEEEVEVETETEKEIEKEIDIEGKEIKKEKSPAGGPAQKGENESNAFLEMLREEAP